MYTVGIIDRWRCLQPGKGSGLGSTERS